MRSTAAKETTTVLVLAIDAKDARETVPPSFIDGPCPWNYIVVTPLAHEGARDAVADELIVSQTMRSSPELQPLVKMVAPCFATTGGIDAAFERAEGHL